MNFGVIWQPSCESMLAAIWNVAPDRVAITVSANRIDQRLERDPLNEGESRDGSFRILFEPPLVADYEVNESLHEVKVLRVRRM